MRSRSLAGILWIVMVLRYLSMSEVQGRTVNSAVLWVSGLYYDVFGWGSPSYAVPEAAEVLRQGLQRVP